jgi:o-succinylbenzoate---CoA ligase
MSEPRLAGLEGLAGLARQPAGAPALAWPGGGMTYGELRAQVAALAAALAAGNASRGAGLEPLPVIARSRRESVLGVLAALELGRPALPLDPARPDLEACLAACAAGGSTDADESPELSPAEWPALLVPTSGTTGGEPRIAMLPVAALQAHVAASAATLPPLSAGDRWLSCLPMTSIGALAALWRVLAAGACFAFLEEFDAGDARRLMAAGTSHVSVVPAMIPALTAVDEPEPKGLRCLLCGGGPLSKPVAELARAAGWPAWNAWGMTETASHIAAGPVDADWEEGIAGRPLPGVAVTPEPASGQLRIRGPMLMSGYARRGLAPGAGLDGDGSFLSSDLGEVLPDGRLRILGRADDVIISGGVNIHPQIIENAISMCAGAGEVGVAGRPDPRWGQVLVALYTGTATPEALEAWAREKLPAALRPREFRRVDALPRNAMGKLLREALAGLAAAHRDG